MSRHEKPAALAVYLQPPYVVLTVQVTTLIRELYISFTKLSLVVIRKFTLGGQLDGDAMEASQLGARLLGLPEVT